MGEQLRDVPPSKQAKVSEDLEKKNGPKRIEQQRAASKQIEGILTPKQLQTYKDRVFPQAAYDTLLDPATLKMIAATPTQKEQLRQIGDEASRRAQRQQKEWTDKKLAVLDAKQQAKLRAAIERNERLDLPELPESGATLTLLVSGTLTLSGSTTLYGDTIDSERPWLMLPPLYGELVQGPIREQLGIDAIQEKQLQAISAKYATESEKWMDEDFKMSKMTPEERERKTPEIAQARRMERMEQEDQPRDRRPADAETGSGPEGDRIPQCRQHGTV